MSSRRVCRWLLAAGLTLAATVTPAAAGPADPTPFVVLQPDGTPLVIRAVGDEWSNAHATLDGFTVVRNNTGLWTYGVRNAAGQLVPTALVAGQDAAPAAARGALADRPQGAPAAGDAAAFPDAMLGARKTLVLLVQFANQTAMTSPAQWTGRFFGTGTGSVNDHYQVSSYGQATIAPATESDGTPNDGVVGWLTLPTNHPNTAQSTGALNQQLTRDAILAADPYVNFAAYDTNGNGSLSASELFIVVIAAGNETSFGGAANACAPSVWGHKWAVASPPTVDGVFAGSGGYAQFGEMHCMVSNPPGEIATIGIMAHELGHLFGLPDLYDTDVTSLGVGEWSLMSYGSWGRVTRSGDSPSLMDPWSKYFLGWVTPTAVVGTMVNQAIPASASSPTVFQFLSGSALTGTGEYFLVENRQKTSFDVSLSAGGLLIWHVDESRPGNTAECVPGSTPVCSATVHYKVALIQADNQYHLERNLGDGDGGDPYPGTSGNTTFNASSAPDSRLWVGTASGVSVSAISASGPTMTATFGLGTPPAAFSKTAPADSSANVGSTTVLAWNASAGASIYEYCYDTTLDGMCTGSWVSAGTNTSANIGGLSGAALYEWQVRAVNDAGPTPANANVWWTFGTTGYALAAFDATLQAPRCNALGALCDSGPSLIRGRGTMSGGAEPNQPNTIYDSCTDGQSGTFHSDESIDRIRVFTTDGQPFAAGKTVTVEVTTWIYNSSQDFLDLYYTTTAASPAWTLIGTLTAPGNGSRVLQASYTLPPGNLQAVRARLRFAGSVGTCSVSSSYDDHDDLVFSSTPSAFVNFVTNGSFASGLTGWSTFATPDPGYLVSSTSGGVLQFHRTAPPPGTSNQAVVFQNTGTALPSGAAIQANFWLGNSDAARKRVSVLLQDADFSDLAVCTFWLPGNLPLTPYQVRTHTTRSWANATIAFYAATANGAGNTTGMYLVDDVQVQYTPNLPAERTECYDPLAPGAPGGAAGANLLTNGDFSSDLSGWTLFGQINGAVNTGVFEFIRLPGTPAGVILQSTGQTMTANQILTATFQLGNSSSVRKRVTVILHDSNFADLSACTFWLAPGQALANYTYRTFATQAWSNATFSVYGATVGPEPSMRVDNVVFHRTPATGIVGTECREP